LGWLPVEVNPDGRSDLLLSDLAPRFHAFLWHGDQVTRLPKSAVLLASSAKCPVQAYRLRDKPVWGVQFNPQYDPVIAEGVIRSATWLTNYGYSIDEMVETGRREYNDVAGAVFGSFLQAVQKGEYGSPKVIGTPGYPERGLVPR
jgi:GMP synthase-like glutamine amidotransferase